MFLNINDHFQLTDNFSYFYSIKRSIRKKIHEENENLV